MSLATGGGLFEGPRCKGCGKAGWIVGEYCPVCIKSGSSPPPKLGQEWIDLEKHAAEEMRKQDAARADNPKPPAVNGAPETSHAAAHALWPRAGTVRRRVLDAYAAAADGLTEEEACGATNLVSNTVRARIWELRGENRKASLPTLLRDSGKRRKSKLGQDCVVWEIVPGVLAEKTP